jgi:hypothetical protein
MIVRREVHDEKEKKRLESNMKYILTGKHPDLKEKLVLGGRNSNQ